MKKIISILLVIFCFLHCRNNNYDQTEEWTIHESVLSLIDTIKLSIDEDSMFFDLTFYSKNDSMFLFIKYDIGPSVISDLKLYNGYYIHNKDYLLIFSSVADNFTENFYKKDKLFNTMEDLKKLSFNIYKIDEKKRYTYYINDDKEMILTDK